MMMSIISAVLIIYAIVIIYLPAKTALDSTLQGPKMCTTLSKEGNLTGEEVCLGWTSCHEWCLSVVSKKDFCSIAAVIVRSNHEERQKAISGHLEISAKRTKEIFQHKLFPPFP